MIVFIHVPKTGGRTLNVAATHLVGARAWCLDSETDLDRELAGVPPGQALDLDYLAGHFRLGYVKPLLAERKAASPSRFVTLVREPVERAFSLYLFLLRVTNAIPHVTKAVEGRDFAYFVDYAYDNAHWHLRDAQAWLLCGERSAQLAKDAIRDELAVVGTTEAWDRFYVAVRHLDCLPFPEDISDFLTNVAPTAHQASDISRGSKPADWREAVGAAVISRLEQLNQADFELYDYVARQRGGLITSMPSQCNATVKS